MKIKPGMLCYIVDAEESEVKGRVVTTIRYVGNYWSKNCCDFIPDAWVVDAQWIPDLAPDFPVVQANCLHPITGPGIESEVLRNADLRVPS